LTEVATSTALEGPEISRIFEGENPNDRVGELK
jgi:hypothetical protein